MERTRSRFAPSMRPATSTRRPPPARGASDTIAPDTAIVSGPSGSVASTTATFDFSSPRRHRHLPVQPRWRAFVACSDPVTFSGLAQGSHTLQVRAVDPVGNVDATPVTRTWTVDTTQPDTTIVSGPSGTSPRRARPSTSRRTRPPSPTSGALDGRGLQRVQRPQHLPRAGRWPHTLQVRAVDAAGNLDATPATRSWRIDTVPPDTTIVSGPSGSVASTTATFDFSSEAGATFQCSLDGAAFTALHRPGHLHRPRAGRATRCSFARSTRLATSTPRPPRAGGRWTPWRPTPASSRGLAAA
jgi:hypothetical protein